MMDVISYLDENEDKRNFEENIAIKTAIYNKKRNTSNLDVGTVGCPSILISAKIYLQIVNLPQSFASKYYKTVYYKTV